MPAATGAWPWKKIHVQGQVEREVGREQAHHQPSSGTAGDVAVGERRGDREQHVEHGPDRPEDRAGWLPRRALERADTSRSTCAVARPPTTATAVTAAAQPAATASRGLRTALIGRGTTRDRVLLYAMWAYAVTTPGRLERIDAPVPEPGPEQVLVRLRAGGICGSDLPSFLGRRNPFVDNLGAPGYPLHEVVGTVVGSGARVVGLGRRASRAGRVLPRPHGRDRRARRRAERRRGHRRAAVVHGLAPARPDRGRRAGARR